MYNATADVKTCVASDEICDVRCEPCTERTGNAQQFCTDIVSFMCNSCRKNHDLFLKGHVFEDEESIPWDLCQIKCSKHTMDITKYYCLKCNAFICETCKNLDHSSCNDRIKSVSSLARGFSDSKDLRDFTRRLCAADEKIEELEATNTTHMSEIERCRDKAINDIEELRDEITSKVFKLSEELCNTVTLEANTYRTNTLSAATELTELKAELHTLKHDLERQRSNGENCLLFKTTKDKDFRKLETAVGELKEAGRIVRYAFRPSEEVEKIRNTIKRMISFGVFKAMEDAAPDTDFREIIRAKMRFFRK